MPLVHAIAATICTSILPNSSSQRTVYVSTICFSMLTLCNLMVTAKPHCQHVNGPDPFSQAEKKALSHRNDSMIQSL